MGPWTLIVVAGVLEIVWALGFKYLKEDAPGWMHAAVYASLVLSFMMLIGALRQLPAGTAYAVWTGIGASGVAIIGMMVFGEPATITRIVCLTLIVCGITGLKLAGG